MRKKRKKTQKKSHFQRYLGYNWVVKNKKAFFGMKEYASIDVRNGLVFSGDTDGVKTEKNISPLSIVKSYRPLLALEPGRSANTKPASRLVLPRAGLMRQRRVNRDTLAYH